MAGYEQLQADAMQRHPPFRKEWWLSCKRHHPDWLYMFWDAATCEGLIAERYPWFLTTYKAIGSVVVRSDAVRIFILHTYGGVYLDMDTECFSSMEPWVTGPQVVLTAEAERRLNNAQMASVAGHKLWEYYQQSVEARLKAKVPDIVHIAGPIALSEVIWLVLGLLTPSLTGHHRLDNGTSVMIYNKSQWFMPCEWGGEDCLVQLAYNKPQMRARALAAAKSASLHSHSSPTPTAPGVPPLMVDAHVPVGLHHFTGTWTNHSNTNTHDVAVTPFMQAAMKGVLDFISNSTSFVEQPCKELKLLGPQQLPVCWEVVAADAAAGRCVVYSVRRLHRHWKEDVLHWFAAEYELADAGCDVHVIANVHLHLPAPKPAGTGTIKSQAYSLGTVQDPFEKPPAASLDHLMQQKHHTQLTLLFLSYLDNMPHATTVLDVLDTMYLVSCTALRRVKMLAAELTSPSQQHELLKLHNAYQHIHQEVGMLGYHQHTSNAVGTSTHMLGWWQEARAVGAMPQDDVLFSKQQTQLWSDDM